MTPISVLVDASQFPEAVRQSLHRSLRARRIEPKFHYDSYKQTQAWLALHEALSPARRDPACLAIYEQSLGSLIDADRSVHLISLGCGGGQKDVLLIDGLRRKNRPVWYSPIDVSLAMTLAACQRAALSEGFCFPAVCDLGSVDNLEALLKGPAPTEVTRVITVFGLLPNLDADLFLQKMARIARPGDQLLLSANLVTGDCDYATAVSRVLPQYDNTLTNEWLTLFLTDLGFERGDGLIRWSVERARNAANPLGLVAWFEMMRARQVRHDDTTYQFEPGDRIQLFGSWRYTPESVAATTRAYGLKVSRSWLTDQEGVFLLER